MSHLPPLTAVAGAALMIVLFAGCDDGTAPGSGTGGGSSDTSQRTELPTRTGTRPVEAGSRRPTEPTRTTTYPTSCAAGLVC